VNRIKSVVAMILLLTAVNYTVFWNYNYDSKFKSTNDKHTLTVDTLHTGYDIFNPILADLNEVNISLRLPSYFAAETFVHPDKPLFGIIESAQTNSHEIQIAATEDCRWNTFCWIGTVSANFDTETDLSTAQSVQLSSYNQGYFIPSECATYCTMSKIIWNENGITYQIEQRGALKETMVLIANSAFEQGIGLN